MTTATTEKYHKIPECGWPCRLDPENENKIDLNDGSNVALSSSKNAYLWYDIEGGLIEQFLKPSPDFDAWAEVHAKLLALRDQSN